MRCLYIFVLIFATWSVGAESRLVIARGEGKLEVVPDIVKIDLTIKGRDKTNVAAAKRDVDATSSRAIAALIQAGVDKSDITSGTLSIETEEPDDNNVPSDLGHVVKREIKVVLRKLSIYNAAIQALVDSGVSDVESVKPDVSNYEELKRDALTKALADARSTAIFLAGQLDARVAKVHQIGMQQTQNNFYGMEEIVVTARRREVKGPIKSVQYEFAPGTIEIASSIYVEFELE